MAPLKALLFVAFFSVKQLSAQKVAPIAPGQDSTFIDAYFEGLIPGPVKVVGVYGDQNYLADAVSKRGVPRSFEHNRVSGRQCRGEFMSG